MRILDEHIEYLTPTVELLRLWFEEFNERFFGGSLERIPLIPRLLEDGVMAEFHYSKRKHNPITQRYTDPLDIKQCYICVAKNTFDSEYEWRDTLLHEMVHYYVNKHAEFLIEDPHGKEFKREARRINRGSEFCISATFEHEVFSPGKRGQIDYQQAQTRQLILGIVHPEENDNYNRFSGGGYYASFLTEMAHIPMLVENWRHMTARIDWYQIDACTKRLLLYDITTWAWVEITNGLTLVEAMEKLSARGGQFETTFLGSTEIDGAAIRGWCPRTKRPRYRAIYALREELCSNAGARHLLRYADKVIKAVDSRPSYKGKVSFSKSPCKLDFDSNYGRVRVFSPQSLRINPISTDSLVKAVTEHDQESLSAELMRLIRFENDIWM